MPHSLGQLTKLGIKWKIFTFIRLNSIKYWIERYCVWRTMRIESNLKSSRSKHLRDGNFLRLNSICLRTSNRQFEYRILVAYFNGIRFDCVPMNFTKCDYLPHTLFLPLMCVCVYVSFLCFVFVRFGSVRFIWHSYRFSHEISNCIEKQCSTRLLVYLMKWHM